jgi:hypothetical protein
MYDKARQTNASARAEQRLHELFGHGRTNAVELWNKARNMVIVDANIYVDDMYFEPVAEEGRTPKYLPVVDGTRRNYTLHRHALTQMATEAKIPNTFVTTLMNGQDWERRELTDLLNERFEKLEFKQRSYTSRASFTNRIVDDEVRGFVSPSFKVWLSTPHMLEAFARQAATFNAMPVEATGSSLRFTFRSFLPHVFEPKDGEFIGIGASFSNSDFGAGVLRVSLDVIRLTGGTSISCVKTIYRKPHSGSARKDQEEDSSFVSQDTFAKLVAAAQGEVYDAVAKALHPDSVNELLNTISKAMSKQISWHTLKEYLGGKLGQSEIKEIEEALEVQNQSTFLPPLAFDNDGKAIIDLWWASNAVGRVADNTSDLDRKADLRDAAGRLLVR